MTNINHIVGDTVTIEVTINNLSKEAKEASLSLFAKKTRFGFDGLIKKIQPTQQIGNKYIFVYNTDDFVKYPITYYGHFILNNNGIILNNFYKIKATY